MRSKGWLLLLLLLSQLLTGCWDRLEVEDQLFPTTMAIDPGERSRYRIMVWVPISAALRSGILGGQVSDGKTAETMMVEADNVIQGIRILNAATARRITLRHLRGLIIGEELAKQGLRDLLIELLRNGEIHETAGVWVARGSAIEAAGQSRPTGEFNSPKINEGLLLVQKGLHMAPPTRLHHMINRTSRIGLDPFAALLGVNARAAGEGQVEEGGESALAGNLDRWGENPVEVAGTAVFQDDRLVGFLTVDETQALLAMRGEMGKAYVTLPDPLNPDGKMMIRFQQENLPRMRAWLTPQGPRVQVRLIFEGEVLSGAAHYSDREERIRMERAATAYMEEQLSSVLVKLKAWQVDPVGFGLRFRSQFFRWRDWDEFDWRKQLAELEVEATAEMRLRRFGMLHTAPYPRPVREE